MGIALDGPLLEHPATNQPCRPGQLCHGEAIQIPTTLTQNPKGDCFAISKSKKLIASRAKVLDKGHVIHPKSLSFLACQVKEVTAIKIHHLAQKLCHRD